MMKEIEIQEVYKRLRDIGEEMHKKHKEMEKLHGYLGKGSSKEVIEQIREGDKDLNEIDRKWREACEQLDTNSV